ncbi:MAG: alpha-amylase family glycosyl hydrolase [Muribaculum sp.]|nr:alpha-amylase family glycosyl hydrolase [Muribaculum sp.]
MRGNKILTFVMAALTAVAAACGSDEPKKPDTTPDPTPNPPIADQSATSDVLYQVNPRFYGKNNCLKAVTADIPRIKSMNVNILWVMPPFELGVEKAIGSPYCIKDFKKIDPTLGTLEDFKALVNEAHANGMKVILDWVANHTSFDNTWTKTNPERYRKDADGNIAATPLWGDVAQLDYNRKSTREGMIDAMAYWVKEADIDGFRCDHADGVPHDFWKEDIEALTAIDKDVFMLAETNDLSFYKDGFYMIYDWNFPGAVTTLFKNGNTSRYLDFLVERNAEVPEGKAMLRYAFNHDVAAENDVATMYTNQDGTILAYLLAAFSGETPMLYSSMDVEGLSGKLSFFGNAHRTLKFSQKLTRIYGEINSAYIKSAAARAGVMSSYASSDAVMISFTNGTSRCLVIANPHNETRAVKTPIAVAGTKMTDWISGEEISVPTAVTLPAFGYMVLGK